MNKQFWIPIIAGCASAWYGIGLVEQATMGWAYPIHPINGVTILALVSAGFLSVAIILTNLWK